MPVDYYPDALDQAASIPPIASALHVAFTSAWTQFSAAPPSLAQG